MCEYNRPYPVPFGQHPDDIMRTSAFTFTNELPSSGQWSERAKHLPEDESSLIAQAVEEGAKIAHDLEIYRYFGTKIIGLAFVPSYTENVRIYEYPPRHR